MSDMLVDEFLSPLRGFYCSWACFRGLAPPAMLCFAPSGLRWFLDRRFFLVGYFFANKYSPAIVSLVEKGGRVVESREGICVL